MDQDRLFAPLPGTKSCTVFFERGERDLLEQGASHIRGLLTGVDETGDTAMLFPPAYGEDWARQVEFDRLKKSELSESHVAALDTLLSLLDATVASPGHPSESAKGWEGLFEPRTLLAP